jgi:hypothetical protein|tara:strand:- start:80 stop:256 length:177 start_codon:yes stop_codon:yes gene_type:complete
MKIPKPKIDIDNPFEKPTRVKPTTHPYLDRYLLREIDEEKLLEIVEKAVGKYLKKYFF